MLVIYYSYLESYNISENGQMAVKLERYNTNGNYLLQFL